MALTALEIATEAAASAGLAIPTTLGVGDDAGRQALALLNRGGRALTEKRGAYGQSWPALTHEHTVSLVDGREYYPLPSGFAGLIADTTWSDRDREPAIGPTTPVEWRTLKGRASGYAGPSVFYRIGQNPANGVLSIRIHPSPTDVEDITFEYLSKWWVRSSETEPASRGTVVRDSDVPIFDEDLMVLDLEWRLRTAEGLSFASQLGDFEVRRDRIFSHISGDSARNVRLDGGTVSPYPNVTVVDYEN